MVGESAVELSARPGQHADVLRAAHRTGELSAGVLARPQVAPPSQEPAQIEIWRGSYHAVHMPSRACHFPVERAKEADRGGILHNFGAEPLERVANFRLGR